MKNLKNKFYAIALILIGILATKLSSDLTALIFMSLIAVPMFFSRKNWIY